MSLMPNLSSELWKLLLEITFVSIFVSLSFDITKGYWMNFSSRFCLIKFWSTSTLNQCRPPFGARFCAAQFCQVSRSQRATCPCMVGWWGIRLVVWRTNERLTCGNEIPKKSCRPLQGSAGAAGERGAFFFCWKRSVFGCRVVVLFRGTFFLERGGRNGGCF